MCTINENPYIKIAQSTKTTEDYVILPDGDTASPYTNVSTVILDADNDPAQGATISVVEDQYKYQEAQADGKVYLEDVDRAHSVQINYAGAIPQVFKVSELPPVVSFSATMLDEVIINAPKKEESNFIPNLVIGVCLAGVIYTVVKVMNEESEPAAQPIHL